MVHAFISRPRRSALLETSSSDSCTRRDTLRAHRVDPAFISRTLSLALRDANPMCSPSRRAVEKDRSAAARAIAAEVSAAFPFSLVIASREDVPRRAFEETARPKKRNQASRVIRRSSSSSRRSSATAIRPAAPPVETSRTIRRAGGSQRAPCRRASSLARMPSSRILLRRACHDASKVSRAPREAARPACGWVLKMSMPPVVPSFRSRVFESAR